MTQGLPYLPVASVHRTCVDDASVESTSEAFRVYVSGNKTILLSSANSSVSLGRSAINLCSIDSSRNAGQFDLPAPRSGKTVELNEYHKSQQRDDVQYLPLSQAISIPKK